MKYLLFILLLTGMACQPSVVKQREGQSVLRLLDAQVSLTVPTVPNGHDQRGTVWRTGRKLSTGSIGQGWAETFIDQDVYETWFVSRTHGLVSEAVVSGEHRLEIPRLKSDQVITRIWMQSDRPVGAEDKLEVSITWLDGNGKTIVPRRSLLAETYGTASSVVLAAPVEARLIHLPPHASAHDVVTAVVQWSLRSPVKPLGLTLMISPQRITDADARTFDALATGKAGWLKWMQQHGASDAQSHYAQFADWFKHSAADYVQANLPRHRREHCYMQAYASRHWYARMRQVDPVAFDSVALTPVWRWPNFHHVNLVTPHDYTGQADLVEAQRGWIFDTWREDGYTINRIMPLKTFRKTFNKLELAKQGYMHENVKQWQRLSDPVPHTGGPVALEHR